MRFIRKLTQYEHTEEIVHVVLFVFLINFILIILPFGIILQMVNDRKLIAFIVSIISLTIIFGLLKIDYKLIDQRIYLIRPKNPMYDLLVEKTIIIEDFFENVYNRYLNTSDFDDILSSMNYGKRIKKNRESFAEILTDTNPSYLLFQKLNTLEIQDLLTKMHVITQDKQLMDVFLDEPVDEQETFLLPILNSIEDVETELEALERKIRYETFNKKNAEKEIKKHELNELMQSNLLELKKINKHK